MVRGFRTTSSLQSPHEEEEDEKSVCVFFLPFFLSFFSDLSRNFIRLSPQPSSRWIILDYFIPENPRIKRPSYTPWITVTS